MLLQRDEDTTEHCLSDDVASAWTEGRLSAAELEVAEAHVDRCDACRRHVANLSALATQGKAAGGDADFGTHIGRYEVTGVVGRGAMGVVVEARDPELGRRVAIKVHRRDAAEGEDLWRRALAEARSLARLEHPNVVRVYDIVHHRGHLCLAMELVEGETLGGWLRSEERPWPQVVRRFIGAAQGLAAVHDAMMVHRDFKPDNVLCSRDGRVLVADFGLARGEVAIPEITAQEAEIESGLRAMRTADGAIVGTPAYMSPEQHLGDAAVAASDQFAFCVSLWEALWGERPFAGESAIVLMRNISAGRFRPIAEGDVPMAVHEALKRGLRPEPTARHASMRELIAILDETVGEAVPERRPFRLVGVVAAVAVLLGAWWLGARDPNGHRQAQPTTVDAVVAARATTPSGGSVTSTEGSSHPTSSTPRGRSSSAVPSVSGPPPPNASPAASPNGAQIDAAAAMARFAESLGPEERLRRAKDPNDKADGLRAEGHCVQATQWYMHARNNARTFFGTNHPEHQRASNGIAACKPSVEAKARSLNANGDSLRAAGKCAAATASYEHAKSTAHHFLGADHPELERAAAGIASCKSTP